MKERMSTWQVLFYLSMAVLALWTILKSIGVINTPPWLEYGVPIGSLLIGFLTMLHTITDKISQLSTSFAVFLTKFEHLEIKTGKIEQKVEQLDIKVNRLERNFEHLDSDVESIKKHLKISATQNA